MYLRLMLAGLIATCASTPAAFAQDHPNVDAKAILAQQAVIRAEAVARAGRYKDMPERKRTELFELQNRISSRLSDHASTTDMPEHDQIIVFNALEAVSAIINRAEDDRMICERNRPVGSNRPATICRSVAQRRIDQEVGAEAVHRRDQR